MTGEQLRLEVSQPLEFIGVCPVCGARTEPVPTEDDGRWWPPIAFIWLALEQHQQEAHGKPVPPEVLKVREAWREVTG